MPPITHTGANEGAGAMTKKITRADHTSALTAIGVSNPATMW
jgi:hypothetical protein